jgi:hypothetical protein
MVKNSGFRSKKGERPFVVGMLWRADKVEVVYVIDS